MKLCCSKKILAVSWGATILFTILTVVGAFLSDRDTSPLLTVASLSWGETATATAFYYWKARAENRIKLTQAMVEAWADKYGIEAVANLANIVLKE
jgi:dolichol kinase